MVDINDSSYDKKIAERLKLILSYAELEILGLAKLTELSVDIIYSILSGRRKLSIKVAKIIGEKLDFEGSILFNLNIPIPDSIKVSGNLVNFRLDNKHNVNYFVSSWNDKKLSSLIKTKLIDAKFFKQQKYTWEVTDELKKYYKTVNSDLVNKQLKYFAKKSVLYCEKHPIKLRDGSYGTRIVDVYFS